VEDGVDGEAGEPLAAHPALADCLVKHQASAEALGADGMHTLWLPIWIGDEATTCLELGGHGAWSGDTVHTVGGIVAVYRNFQNLLDYSERDSLTGLLNRKTFDHQLARMLHHAPEGDARLPGMPERRQQDSNATGDERQWLAVVDVDQFKRSTTVSAICTVTKS
jgi:hypothetical protein